MSFKAVFAALILLAAPRAHAVSEMGREFGFFAGAGLSRQFASVQQPSVDAKLKGWSNFAEVGIDLPFTDSFGFSPSVELSQSELTNSFQSATYLDRTTIDSKSVRGAFYFKGVSLGGSFRKMDVTLKTVSSTNGASSAKVSGDGHSGFVGYSFVYRGVLRTSVEAEMTQFSSQGFEYKDTSVALRLHLLFGGIFGQ